MFVSPIKDIIVKMTIGKGYIELDLHLMENVYVAKFFITMFVSPRKEC